MKPAWKKPFIVLLSAGALLALLLLFVRWQMDDLYRSAPSRIAALVSAALFAAVGLPAVPRWADFWSAGEEDMPCINTGIAAWKVFLALLTWDLAALLLSWPLRCMIHGPMTLAQSMGAWVCGDSVHYLDIARDWYLSEGIIDRVVQLVFLPGYPLLIRLAHVVIRNWTYAALTVSGLCFAGAGTVLYKLMRLDLDERAARRGIAALCLFPGSFFFAAPMSESLFLLCCVGCLYLARTGKWLPGCLLGAWAAFTRSLGITLLVPLVMELVHGSVRKNTAPAKERLAAWLSLVLVPLGFGAYLLVNRLVAGDPFQFLIYQSEHWHQNFGLFFNTAAYQTDCAISTFHDNPHSFLGLWLPNLIASFAALALMVCGARQLRASWSVWFIPYYFIAIGATWLLSAPRYLLAFFPLSETAALLAEKRGMRALVFIVLAVLSALYFLAFLARWQVF